VWRHVRIRPGYTGGVPPSHKASGDKHFTAMETRSGSDERRCARGRREPGGRSDEAIEFADAEELHQLRCEQLRGDRSAVAERAKPVTEHAVFRRGGLCGGCETRVVIGVLVRRRQGVVVVGRVPAAQRACQDEDDRQCDERLRAKSQRT
jgi:hypothetical protein